MRGSLPERCPPSIGQEPVGWPAMPAATPDWGDCCSGTAGVDVGGCPIRSGSGVMLSTLVLVLCDMAGVLGAAEAGMLGSIVEGSV